MKDTMSLAEANTLGKICCLPRDYFEAGDYWIMSDGHTVTLCAQKLGEESTAKVSIPLKEFNRLVRFFRKPQRVRKKKGRPA